MIALKNLQVNLGGKAILEDLNFRFEKTGLYVILGNNGAGKTTLLKTICGLQNPNHGIVEAEGKSVHQLSLSERSSIIQYVDDPSPIPAFIKLTEYLTLGYQEDGVQIETVMQQLQLVDLKDREVASFSRGQQQKSMLAKLFYGDQPVWLMDEPSNYLDYPSLLHFWAEIQEKAKQKLIIATLHNPEEAIKLDAQILIIKQKRLNKSENPSLNGIIQELN
ncbi:ABC transporter ATP-binding protein [Bacteroidia bacterium]|nr:ABC transporter ATP-binding protein [Bacteroidia bacterium]